MANRRNVDRRETPTPYQPRMSTSEAFMKNFLNVVTTLIVITLAFSCQRVAAYATETHALITRTAFARSILGDPNAPLYVTLGIKRFEVNKPLDVYWRTSPDDVDAYYYSDGIGTSNEIFHTESYERCQMNEFNYSTVPADSGNFLDVVRLDDAIMPLQNWVVRGAIREDDTGVLKKATNPGNDHCGEEFSASSQGFLPRSLNHFYDPSSDQPLSPCPAVNGSVCNRATDWALGYVGSDVQQHIDGTRSNFYTYADARNYYWDALTRESHRAADPARYYGVLRELDAEDRMHAWASMFRSMGDVVHLLEDMAQPQHTRNDAHSGLNSPEKQSFEGFTNDRVLGLSSGVGDYVHFFFNQTPSLFPPIKLGNYPGPGGAVMFAKPLDFFTTRLDSPDLDQRYGLADYTNRGFFTAGTLPGTDNHMSPPAIDGNYGVETGSEYSVESPTCESLLNADVRLRAVTCTHYTRAVVDSVSPSYVDTTLPNFIKTPVVSESIFRAASSLAAANMGVDDIRMYEHAIGIAELEAMGNLTVPRAIGYATGMLNYFFRGTLEVKPPDDGVVSVINQGTPHHQDEGYPIKDGSPFSIFGFEKVRLKVKNTTPPITISGSGKVFPQLTDFPGKIVAVAKFHRNPCYQPDLSGEISYDAHTRTATSSCASSPFTNVDQQRTAYSETAVSAEVDVGNNELDADNYNVTFDFSGDPIPINATDLFIQVVYRGYLGLEQDGIAVGSYDVSEPTYSTFVNADNYYEYAFAGPGNWQYADQPPAQQDGVNTVTFCIGQKLVFRYHYGETPTVGIGLLHNQFLRIAMLLDQTPRARRVFSSYPETKNGFEGAPVQPDDPVMSYHLATTGEVNQAPGDHFGTYNYPLRTSFLGIIGDFPLDYQAYYLTTVADWIDEFGQPTIALLHPANPDASLYSFSTPIPLPTSGSYLPEKDHGAVFDTDKEGWCALPIPTS